MRGMETGQFEVSDSESMSAEILKERKRIKEVCVHVQIIKCFTSTVVKVKKIMFETELLFLSMLRSWVSSRLCILMRRQKT